MGAGGGSPAGTTAGPVGSNVNDPTHASYTSGISLKNPMYAALAALGLTSGSPLLALMAARKGFGYQPTPSTVSGFGGSGVDAAVNGPGRSLSPSVGMNIDPAMDVYGGAFPDAPTDGSTLGLNGPQGYADLGGYADAADSGVGTGDSSGNTDSGGGEGGGDYAGGGLASVGQYLRGPGDGMSDHIPAQVGGPGGRQIRVAANEYVVPADVVSHLGNGSSDAGARVLDQMGARARKARTGNPKQGRRINPNKILPR